MPETKSRFLNKILESQSPEPDDKGYTSERQHTAQSLTLHVDYRDGLSGEGTAWSHLGRYKWRDQGSHESLRIIFGPMCAMEIIGHNLGVLVGEIREGQLNGIKEMISGQSALAIHEGSKEPVITGVSAYPDFDTLFEEIKEEAKGDSKDAAKTRFTERFER
jgi:hypothetical protein